MQIEKICFENFYLLSKETTALLDTLNSRLSIALRSSKSLKNDGQSLQASWQAYSWFPSRAFCSTVWMGPMMLVSALLCHFATLLCLPGSLQTSVALVVSSFYIETQNGHSKGGHNWSFLVCWSKQGSIPQSLAKRQLTAAEKNNSMKFHISDTPSSILSFPLKGSLQHRCLPSLSFWFIRIFLHI